MWNNSRETRPPRKAARGTRPRDLHFRASGGACRIGTSGTDVSIIDARQITRSRSRACSAGSPRLGRTRPYGNITASRGQNPVGPDGDTELIRIGYLSGLARASLRPASSPPSFLSTSTSSPATLVRPRRCLFCSVRPLLSPFPNGLGVARASKEQTVQRLCRSGKALSERHSAFISIDPTLDRVVHSAVHTVSPQCHLQSPLVLKSRDGLRVLGTSDPVTAIRRPLTRSSLLIPPWSGSDEHLSPPALLPPKIVLLRDTSHVHPSLLQFPLSIEPSVEISHLWSPMDRSLRTPYNLRSFNQTPAQNTSAQPSFASSTSASSDRLNAAGSFDAMSSSQPQIQKQSAMEPDNQAATLLPSPAGNEPRPFWSQTQPQSCGMQAAASEQEQQQGPNSAPFAQAVVDYYPHRNNEKGGPMATAPFLRDFSLVAEAAKRAQMAVVMRDLESVTL